MEVSIIVPVFNAEATLDRCIESVLQQKFKDFELILINDGSTDNSAEICNRYVQHFPNIHVFHTENGGVSSARNKGISIAKGRWIVFLDSDDYVSEEYLFNLMSSEADFVISGVNLLRGNQKIEVFPPKQYARNLGELPLFVHRLEQTGFIIYGPCQKRFKREIIDAHNLRFRRDLDYGEDTIFVLNYLCFVSSAESLDKSDYNYIQENSLSLSGTINFDRRLNYLIHLERTLGELIDIIYKSEYRFSKNGFSEMLLKQALSTVIIIYKDLDLYKDRQAGITNVREILNGSKWFIYKIYRVYEISLFLTLFLGLNRVFDLFNRAYYELKINRRT
ncbi:glycosyltransferase family 2 protein [Sphingobacterium thalpophilum]|uniref:glycosyltransferase family 2 protein n=1 Tax=Sphingobacterium thalpophilum TaxID=259 RepID=UPI003DA28FF4